MEGASKTLQHTCADDVSEVEEEMVAEGGSYGNDSEVESEESYVFHGKTGALVEDTSSDGKHLRRCAKCKELIYSIEGVGKIL